MAKLRLERQSISRPGDPVGDGERRSCKKGKGPETEV